MPCLLIEIGVLTDKFHRVQDQYPLVRRNRLVGEDSVRVIVTLLRPILPSLRLSTRSTDQAPRSD